MRAAVLDAPSQPYENLFVRPGLQNEAIGAIGVPGGYGYYIGAGPNAGSTQIVAAPWARSGKAWRVTWSTRSQASGDIGLQLTNAGVGIPTARWADLVGQRVTAVFDLVCSVGGFTQNSMVATGTGGTVTVVASSGNQAVVAGVPLRCWVTFTVGAGTTAVGSIRAGLTNLPLSAGVTAELSNAQVYLGDYQPGRPYGDGSVPGWKWDGTAGASVSRGYPFTIPALRSFSTGTVTGTSATITLPSGWLAGDYLTLVVSSNQAPVLSFTAGVASSSVLADAAKRLQVFRVVPNPGATSITLTADVSSVLTWWIGAWANVAPGLAVASAADNLGSNTTAVIAVPAVPLGYTSIGREVLVTVAAVNATATWAIGEPVPIFVTTSGNSALAIRAVPLPAGLTTALAIPATFDRGNEGTTRNESAVAFVLCGLVSPVVAANVLSNGGFADATAWSGLGYSGKAITGGKLVFTASPAYDDVNQPVNVTADKYYELAYTVSGRTSGTVFAQLSGGTTRSSTVRNANGTFTERLLVNSGNNTFRIMLETGGTLSVDDVSLIGPFNTATVGGA